MTDICIIGGGVTGLATAYYLKKSNINSVEVRTRGIFKNVLGLVMASHRDNITRLATAHGEEFAIDFLNFFAEGRKELVNYCTEHHLTATSGNKIRWGQKDFEKLEMQKAQKLLGSTNLKVQYKEDDSNFLQTEADSVTFVDYQKLVTSLESEVQEFIKVTNAPERNLEPFAMIVCANHFNVSKVLPHFANCFVTAQDQWWSYARPKNFNLTPYDFLAFENGHDWIYSTVEKIYMGGGRYMRKWAGFEAETAFYDTLIERKISSKISKIIGEKALADLKPVEQVAFLDCFPCDELPVVGPNFGDSRFLVGSGYLGCGIAPAFLAGKCLAELIVTGKSESLPRRFYPERLRSL